MCRGTVVRCINSESNRRLNVSYFENQEAGTDNWPLASGKCPMIQTLDWTDQGVRFLDQTKLPTEETYVTCKTHEQVVDVTRNMVVRGARDIGVAAGIGIALGGNNSKAESVSDLK